MPETKINKNSYIEDFEPEKDKCPYCGELFDYSAPYFCEHVFAIHATREIIYANPDFYRIAEHLYGIPEIVFIDNDEDEYFENKSQISTKRFGLLPAASIFSGVMGALQEACVAMTIADTDEYEPAEIIFVEKALPKHINYSYVPIEEKAKALLASVYLDTPYGWDCDSNLPRYNEFYELASELFYEVRKIQNPVESMLFYVNGKKRLCKKYNQPYSNKVKDFELFEKEIFYKNHTSGYAIRDFDVCKKFLPNSAMTFSGVPDELIVGLKSISENGSMTLEEAIKYSFKVVELLKTNDNLMTLVQWTKPEVSNLYLKKFINKAVTDLIGDDCDASYEFLSSDEKSNDLLNVVHWILGSKSTEAEVLKSFQINDHQELY